MKCLFFTANLLNGFDVENAFDTSSNGAIYQTLGLAREIGFQGHEVIITAPSNFVDSSGFSFRMLSDIARGAHFDVILAVNNIAFIEALNMLDITFDRSVLLSFSNTCETEFAGHVARGEGKSEFLNDRLNWILLRSQKHKDNFTINYPAALLKATTVNDSIVPSDLRRMRRDKVAGRFIFMLRDKSSFDKICTFWLHIRSILPNATLHVATPFGGQPYEDLNMPGGVKILGRLTKTEFQAELNEAEFWLDLSDHHHEGNLAVLEAIQSKVKVISFGNGAFEEFVERFGYKIRPNGLGEYHAELLEVLDKTKREQMEWDNKLEIGNQFVQSLSFEAQGKKVIDLINTPAHNVDRSHLLYAHASKPEEWERRYLSPAVRTKNWELIREEPVDGCFTMPLFSKAFCNDLRELVGEFGHWPIDFYQTYRLNVETLGLHEAFTSVINKFMCPCASQFYLDPDLVDHPFRVEAFITKYDSAIDSDAISDHPIHHDGSYLSSVVMLSEQDEYEGGGTFFSKQKTLVKTDAGVATVFPGSLTHRHGARKVESGIRYICAIFLHKT